MASMTKANPSFIIGPLRPLPGLEGERIVAGNNLIAAVSSRNATWMKDDKLESWPLPNINTRNVRWTADEKFLCLGTGKIDIDKKRWINHPGLQGIEQWLPSGAMSTRIKSTSWHPTGQFVAVLIEEMDSAGLRAQRCYVVVYEAESLTPYVTIPTGIVENIFMLQDQLVILAEEVSVWTLNGECLAKLPLTKSAPFKTVLNFSGTRLLLQNHDWSIRIIDTGSWQIVSTGDGIFHDVVIGERELIALDLEGHLHAACLNGSSLAFFGDTDTSLIANQLSINAHRQLFMISTGAVAVHTRSYEVFCV